MATTLGHPGRVVLHCYAGGAITKGDLVATSGTKAFGNDTYVQVAKATGSTAIGVALATAAQDEVVPVAINGFVAEAISKGDANAISAGDGLEVSGGKLVKQNTGVRVGYAAGASSADGTLIPVILVP